MWLGPLLLAALAFWVSLGWWAWGYTVTDDMGGPVQARLEDMQSLHGVRIEGRCYSACTLYLGLPDTCVTLSSRLGFHSPYWRLAGFQMPLPFKEWERVTLLMAAQYPEPMRDWWMRDARHRIDTVVISGARAVEMGAKRCD